MLSWLAFVKKRKKKKKEEEVKARERILYFLINYHGVFILSVLH